MKLTNLLKGHKGVDFYSSKTKTYVDSDTAICFLALADNIAETGQDHLVFSRTAAEAVMAKPESERMAFIKTLDATLGETINGKEVYGITMPINARKLGSLDF